MSDNTAAGTLTPCKYHRFYESACRQCAIANNDGGPFLPSSIPPQCELVDKAALDALREAVKPLEKWAADFDKWAATASRDPAPSRILPDMRHLLDACNRLLGSEIER